MATYITPQVVAKLGIIALLNNWVFAGLVHRDYSKEFKKVGDTVIIKKPNTFTAIEFDGDLSGQWQEPAEESTTVVMDKLLTVPIQITQTDLTLKISQFYERIIEPALQALAQEVDSRLAGLYVDIPYFVNTSGTTTVANLLDARRIQSDNKVPAAMRYAVMSPLTTAALLGLDAFRALDKTGTTRGLREASLGRIFQYDFYENQNIKTHAIGTGSSHMGAEVDGEHAAGVTSVLIDELTDGYIYSKGTLLTITGEGQHVVVSHATITSNEALFVLYPALRSTVSDGDTISINTSATTSKDNLMFHKNAFSLVTAPIEPPMGGAKGETVSYKGISLNVVYSYDHDKFLNKMTISLLCGFKTLTPELAVRLHDES